MPGQPGDESELGVAERRPVLYCLIPSDLAPKLHDVLRHHFAGRGGVEVVVERRAEERRGDIGRRGGEGEPPAAEERRRVKGTMGRRIGERRAALIPVDDAPELPRRARRYADRITFAERLEPSTEEAENLVTDRLIASIQSGESDAFTELYTRYFDRVYGYLRVALRDVHEAEDTTQQVFMRVFESLPEYERRGRPFRNWLFAIAKNHAVSALRRSGRVELEETERIERRRDTEVTDEPQLTALNWLSDRDLMLFAERLPLAQRQVLALRYMMDLSNAEVAEILGRSVADVKTLHSRGVRFLRQRFAAIGRTPTRRGDASLWPVFRQAEVLRHRRFALH